MIASVQELAGRCNVRVVAVLKELMRLGESPLNVEETLSVDIAELVGRVAQVCTL